VKLWVKTEEFREGKFLVVRRDGTVPHWPHMVLGARDPWAPQALRYYAEIARANGADDDYCDSVNQLADDFEMYRAVYGKGDPEAPPHRRDDQYVINAMRGGKAIITVRPDGEKTRAGLPE
jgi:hypothetical protein